MRMPHGETVTVKRYVQGPHGDRELVSEHTIEQFAIFIRTSTEPLDMRSDVVTTATGIGPYGSDLLSDDQVVQPNGRHWEVVGIPNDLKSPITGLRANQISTLVHVSG